MTNDYDLVPGMFRRDSEVLTPSFSHQVTFFGAERCRLSILSVRSL